MLFHELERDKVPSKTQVVRTFIVSEENGDFEGVGIKALIEIGSLDFSKKWWVFWVDCFDSQPCINTLGVITWTLKATGKLFHSGLLNMGTNGLDLSWTRSQKSRSTFTGVWTSGKGSRVLLLVSVDHKAYAHHGVVQRTQSNVQWMMIWRDFYCVTNYPCLHALHREQKRRPLAYLDHLPFSNCSNSPFPDSRSFWIRDPKSALLLCLVTWKTVRLVVPTALKRGVSRYLVASWVA